MTETGKESGCPRLGGKRALGHEILAMGERHKVKLRSITELRIRTAPQSLGEGGGMGGIGGWRRQGNPSAELGQTNGGKQSRSDQCR